MLNKAKLTVRKLLSTISPKLASKILFKLRFKKNLNLKDPKSLNEKLMWLKLNTYNNNPLITMCADKYKVRDYITEKNYEGILNPLIDTWTSVEQINWDSLPNKFVIKCNHGAGYNLICKDKTKLNIEDAKNKLNEWLREDYWKKRAELNYKYIEKRIICEEFIETKDGALPIDYKFYCINGKVDSVMLCLERENGNTKLFFL